MRTTIDLPDDLFRMAKSTAALRGLPLKDLITSFVRAGLSSGAIKEPRGHATPLPEFIPRTGVTIPLLSGQEIEDILMDREIDVVNRPA